jgi:hypothetical protein
MGINNEILLNLHDGWEDQTVYTFKGPDDSGVQHMLTLTVDRHAGAESVTDFAQDCVNVLEGTLQSMEILKEEEITLKDGKNAYECIYKWIPVEGDVRFIRNIYLLIDGVGYTFSGNFSKKTIQTIGTEMDAIVNSFRPTPPDLDSDTE